MVKYSRRSIKRMIRRILEGSCSQCGGSRIVSRGDVSNMNLDSCKSTLNMVVDKYQDCRMNISGSPILPPSIRGDQSCNSMCPMTQDKCLYRYPKVCKMD